MGESKATATPGPWLVAGAAHVYADGPGGANICSVSEPRGARFVGYTPLEIGSRDFAEACANARLIAAAPALRDALQLLSDEINDPARRTDSGALVLSMPAMKVARAALDATEPKP